MNTLFKDLSAGNTIYALIKRDNEIVYSEGTIVSIGQQRMDMSTPHDFSSVKTVVDVTYCIEGKNYTDAVSITDSMFPTNNPGAISLIATDKAPIIQELRATRKKADDYIKATETEIPRNKKRVEDCDTLISLLDTEYAEKQEFEKRIKKLEDSGIETNRLLSQILAKLK
jgi:hypothetical protein